MKCTYFTAVAEYCCDALLGTEGLGQDIDEMRNNCMVLVLTIIKCT